jgi:hypothetical protein
VRGGQVQFPLATDWRFHYSVLKQSGGAFTVVALAYSDGPLSMSKVAGS